MIFLKEDVSFLMVVVLSCARGDLSPTGNNVCTRTITKSYTKYIPQEKKIIEHKKRWCWNPLEGFRCSYTEEKTVVNTVPKVVSVPSIVPECCEGYEESFIEIGSCSPVCDFQCLNGDCVEPNVCSCHSGFHGLTCEDHCPLNFWGENCRFECDCDEKEFCDSITGECICEEGRYGNRCETPCPQGYYGKNCEEKCMCVVCNPVTGECITETTTPTEISTTTETTTNEATTSGEIDYFENTDPVKYTTSTENIKISTEEILKESTTVPGETVEEISTVPEETTKEMYTTTEETTKEIFTETEKTTEEITTVSVETTTVTEGSSTIKEKWSTTVYPELTTEAKPVTEVIFKKKIYHEVENNLDVKESEDRNTVHTSIVTTIPKYSENSIEWDGVSDTNSEMSDTEETENKISHESSRSQKLMNFIPSLSVITAVSIVLFIIAGVWYVGNRRRKAEKASNERVVFYPNAQEYNGIFCVSNVAENPAFASDLEPNEPVPYLQTFKPLSLDTFSVKKS